jgi:hypothetical protein
VNTFLAPVWDEHVVRLRVGIEPVDALSPERGPHGAPSGLAVHVERVPLPHPLPPRPADPGAPVDGIGLPALRRSPSGRFALAFGSRQTDTPARIEVRIVDHLRRHVPRRLSVPAPDLAGVLAADRGGAAPERACRPVLLPAPAYGLVPGATAVRGQAVWGADGAPAQWVRVEARLSGAPAVSWRAHGDDRGEFLLVVGPLDQLQAMALTGTLDVDVTVHARPRPPDGSPVASPSASRDDPLWHLPIESVGGLGPGDPVALGTVVPPGYAASATRPVQCRRGDVVRTAPFVLT